MRSLARLAERTYDLVILGGGVTGACVARDAALRGLRVVLVEKQDFCSATSAASSKLIHGGLRYLKNLEFGLVRESLRERRLWSCTRRTWSTRCRCCCRSTAARPWRTRCVHCGSARLRPKPTK